MHPSIYAIYDLVELVPDPLLAQQIREHVVCIEDSFVNSQEWTLSRGVPDIRLGIVGSLSSGKSALVHRYLTGSYMQEESPEGGRFKKEVVVDGHSYLLLIRDEGGPPELQFTSWVDAVIFVFSLENETSFNAIYNYYAKMSQYRNMQDIPLILVGTQDSISENHPRVIDDLRARKLASDLKKCAYYETCATYGLNVERVFQDACQKITVSKYHGSRPSTPSGYQLASRGSYPNPGSVSSYHLPSPSNNGYHHIGTPSSPGVHSPVYHRDTRIHDLSRAVPTAVPTPVLPPQPPPNGAAATVPAAVAGGNSGAVHSSGSNSGSEMAGKFIVPNEKNFMMIHGGSGGGTENKENQKEMMPPQPPPPHQQHQTPSSTPTSARKNRRRSNLFTPSKKSDDKPASSSTASNPGSHPPNQPQMGSGRSIPTRQGYLYKKSNKSFSKDWKKKYVTLSDDFKLTYHATLHDYMENTHGKEISLQYVTVKVPGQKPRGSRTVPNSASANNTSESSVSTSQNQSGFNGKSGGGGGGGGEKVLLTGYEMIKDPSGGEDNTAEVGAVSVPAAAAAAAAAADKSMAETPNVKKRHRRMKSNGVKSNGDGGADDADMFEFHIVSLDNKQWFFEASSAEERDEWVAGIEQLILNSLQGNEINKSKGQGGATNAVMNAEAIKTIKSDVAGNGKCVDCDAPAPDWASINLGVLICIECSGVHRQLGSHISRVRSLDLDEWPPGHLAVMTSVGNRLANAVWEANLATKRPSVARKPGPGSSQEEKERYIVAKYSRKDFLAALPSGMSAAAALLDAILRSDMKSVSLALAHASQEDVNAPISPRDARTPLHLATSLGSLPIVQLLIWSNANVKSVDHDGRTCISYARNCSNGAAGGGGGSSSSINQELVELLLNNGCPDVGLTGTLPRQHQRRNSLTRGDKITSSVL